MTTARRPPQPPVRRRCARGRAGKPAVGSPDPQQHRRSRHRVVGRGAAPKGDAIVTRHPGIAVAILTADCAPVLIADTTAASSLPPMPAGKAPRPACSKSTIAAMERLGASAGTSLPRSDRRSAQGAYEVGPEFRDRFMASEPAMPASSRCRTGRCTTCSICPAIPPTGSSPGPAAGRSISPPAPTPRRAVLQLSARHPPRLKPIMAARSRR